MLDRPFSDVQCKAAGYPLHSHLSLSLPLLCVTVCHLISNAPYHFTLHTIPEETGSQNMFNFSVFPSGECQMITYKGSSKNFCTSFFWLYLLRTSKTNYITFLHSHPALQCIFSQRPTNFLMPSAKNVFGWARSHWCTAAFTSSSHENRLAFLSGQKRWKSDGAKFGL